MRIFIAGASADRQKIGELIQALPSYGCTGYDWTVSPGYDDPLRHCPIRAAIASSEEIDMADGLILHVSEHPSPGATGEAITAFHAGVPIVVLVDVPIKVCPTEGVSYNPRTTPFRQRIPAENIWAHWLAVQCTAVDSFEDAMRELLGAEVVA